MEATLVWSLVTPGDHTARGGHAPPPPVPGHYLPRLTSTRREMWSLHLQVLGRSSTESNGEDCALRKGVLKNLKDVDTALDI